jgi:Rrf2 family protein
MRVTTWAEYGLIVTVHLARRAGEGPIAAREVAEQERLPADYVEQILLRLRRSGLVTSVRGARGGYLLARQPEDITVKDVLNAAEHGTFEVNCDVHRVNPDAAIRRRRAASGRCGGSCSGASTRPSRACASAT